MNIDETETETENFVFSLVLSSGFLDFWIFHKDVVIIGCCC